MKRFELKQLKETLDGVSKELPISLLIIIEKNKQVLEKEYNLTKAIIECAYFEEYKTYDAKVKELKDEELKEYTSSNKELLERQNKRIKDVEAFLTQNVEIELEKISIEDLPEELEDKIESLVLILDD